MTEMEYRAEADEAKALVDTLLERVREGDESVTPEEIDNARKLAEFAELRGEAAERKAWQAACDEAAAEQEDAALALKALISTTPKDITSAEQKAIKAFETLMSALDGRYIAVFHAARRLRIANQEAAEYDLPTSMDAHGVGYNVGADRFEWIDDRGSRARLDWGHLKDAKRWVKAVIEPANLRLTNGTGVENHRRVEKRIES